MGKVIARKAAPVKKKRAAAAEIIMHKRRKTSEAMNRFSTGSIKRKQLLANPFIIAGTQITIKEGIRNSIVLRAFLKERLKRLVNPFGSNGIPFEKQNHLFFEFESNRNALQLKLMTRQEREITEKAQANLSAKMRY